MTNDGIDILLERRNEFEVGGKMFHIAPPSLGKLFVLQGIIADLDINEKSLAAIPSLEMLRVAEGQKDVCCELIAYATCDNRNEINNGKLIAKRKKHFAKHLDTDEIATLLVAVMQYSRHRQWMDEVGITEERERMMQVVRHKDKEGSVTFGGKTIFGQLIDPAMERYGWTYDYAVWGVSAAVLEILTADKVNEVYLSEEDLKKIPRHLVDNDRMDGDDPSNYERMMKIFG